MHPNLDQSGLPEWFSTHSNPDDRDVYLKHMDGQVFGENPREGFVQRLRGGDTLHEAGRKDSMSF